MQWRLTEQPPMESTSSWGAIHPRANERPSLISWIWYITNAGHVDHTRIVLTFSDVSCPASHEKNLNLTQPRGSTSFMLLPSVPKLCLLVHTSSTGTGQQSGHPMGLVGQWEIES